KTSLEKYGRFIFGESYSAMKAGPVPSNAYDLIKSARETKEFGFAVKDDKIVPLRKAKLDRLSESDIECLNQIVALYGNVPNWKRIEDSHDAAYHAAWDSRGDKKSVPMQLEQIIDLFDDADDLKEYVFNRDAEAA
ncbi:MAG: SocA family protein, partial [Chloroflexota bacterium]|nr:SocA family protein [Chloroflexota bacterium]